MFKLSATSLVCFTLLTACGSSDKSDTIEIPSLNAVKPAMSELSKPTKTTFAQHVKNGIYLRFRHNYTATDGVVTPPVVTSPVTSTPEFSQTNNQEQNVSEADRIQFNGNYLFIAAQNDLDIEKDEEQNTSSYVRILKRGNDDLLSQVSTINASNEDGIDLMYLENDSLVTISKRQWFDILPFQFISRPNSFTLSFYDVTLPEQPSAVTTLLIDGNMVDSRVADGNLYVVSNYFPTVNSLVPEVNDAAKLANYNLIQKSNINDLMPKITRNASTVRENLVNPDACLLPVNSTDKDGYDGITTITKINIAAPSEFQSICINTQIDGLYASQDALYAYTTIWQSTQQTAFHKFSISDSFGYQATGVINGRLTFNMANLRISEYNNQLRVITTEDIDTRHFKHSLYIMEQQGSKLNTIGQYPSNGAQTPLGKTNNQGQVFEDIYAARFFNNRAYIVTFERTDPLYTLDLSTPSEPKLLGALEIPGYSSYLHPMGESHLIGIGQEVETVITEDGRAVTVSSGSKIALFDVTNLSNPTLLTTKTFENAYSPVEFDYHAFTSLAKGDGTTRIALPLESWTQNESDNGTYWQSHNELALLEMQPISDSPMRLIGTSKINNLPDTLAMYISGYNDRSVLINDSIYYIHGNYVWHSKWSMPSENIGPQ